MRILPEVGVESERGTAINQQYVDQIAKMFPSGVVVLGAPVGDHTSKLLTPEKDCIAASVEKRKNEFSTGRLLAAEALEALQIPRRAITKGADNEPLWPEGIVGSISHDSRVCIVVLARNTICGGIGVDVENRAADVEKISSLIMRDDEIQAPRGGGKQQFDRIVRLTFSAKESVFKAIYPHVKRFVDFDEVRLVFDIERQLFRAEAPDNGRLNEMLKTGQGAYRYFPGFLATGFYLPGTP